LIVNIKLAAFENVKFERERESGPDVRICGCKLILNLVESKVATPVGTLPELQFEVVSRSLDDVPIHVASCAKMDKGKREQRAHFRQGIFMNTLQ
jgi:hypothetical protein